jgi:Leucine-rich repeat (LRR) protein
MTGMANMEEARKRIAQARRINGERLDLDKLGLETFPEEILALHDLQELDLRNNKLRSIPDGIRSLRHLKNVFLED